MKIGAIFPTTEIGNDPAAIRDWAQAAESLGYEFILTFDHVLGAEHADRDPAFIGPYTEKDPFHEPFTLFGFLAGVTERIELATGVIILPQRQTALVAKQAAEIDVLSGGRLRLGVGTGWNHAEYTALGAPWSERGSVLDEQIPLLRRLWSGEVIEFEGEHHRIERAGILPAPAHPIEIWLGAIAPVAVRRAARLGDGIILATQPSSIQGLWEKTLEEVDRAGRSRADFGGEASVDFSLDRDRWGKEAELWRSLGGTHLSLRAMDTAAEAMGLKHVGYKGPQDYIDALRVFKQEIG